MRGYSALLILERLMEAISHPEASESNGEVRTGYQPLLPPSTTSTVPSNRITKGKREKRFSLASIPLLRLYGGYEHHRVYRTAPGQLKYPLNFAKA